MNAAASVADRICARAVEDADGCWIWQGRLSAKGYGDIRVAARSLRAHRASYEAFVADIPERLQLDHLCRQPACVNPWHLEPVTLIVNVRRGGNAQKTHCPQGHPYDATNVYVRPDGTSRDCRICIRASIDRYRARKRAARKQHAHSP